MAPTSDAGGGWNESGTTSEGDYRYRVPAGESVSEAVVAAVAAATGRQEVVAGPSAGANVGADVDSDGGARSEGPRADVEASALAPLYETVDPDALDALFRPDGVSPVAVTFTYSGREVTVEGGTVVRVSGG